jgi:hypothetical protein
MKRLFDKLRGVYKSPTVKEKRLAQKYQADRNNFIDSVLNSISNSPSLINTVDMNDYPIFEGLPVREPWNGDGGDFSGGGASGSYE